MRDAEDSRGCRRPSPPARAPGPRQSVPGASSPLFPEPVGKQQQLQQQARGTPGGKSGDSPQSHPRRLLESRTSPYPRPRGARGPAPKRPLTRGGSRGGLRRPQLPPPPPPHSPQLQLPRWGVGGVAGWRMLLPTEGRGRNGNRNRRRRRLTEPSAPLTEREREAARAGQSLTARDRARAGSRARDPEQHRPHSARRGRGPVGWGWEGAVWGGGLELREPGYSGRSEITRARAAAALTTSAGGEALASASVRARVGARAPQRYRLLGEGAHAPAAATYGDPGMCHGFFPPPSCCAGG